MSLKLPEKQINFNSDIYIEETIKGTWYLVTHNKRESPSWQIEQLHVLTINAMTMNDLFYKAEYFSSAKTHQAGSLAAATADCASYFATPNLNWT